MTRPLLGILALAAPAFAQRGAPVPATRLATPIPPRSAATPTTRVAPPATTPAAIPGSVFTTPTARLTPQQRAQLAAYGAGATRWRGLAGAHQVWMQVPCSACRGGRVWALVFVRDGLVEAVQPLGDPGDRVVVQVPRR